MAMRKPLIVEVNYGPRTKMVLFSGADAPTTFTNFEAHVRRKIPDIRQGERVEFVYVGPQGQFVDLMDDDDLAVFLESSDLHTKRVRVVREGWPLTGAPPAPTMAAMRPATPVSPNGTSPHSPRHAQPVGSVHSSQGMSHSSGMASPRMSAQTLANSSMGPAGSASASGSAMGMMSSMQSAGAGGTGPMRSQPPMMMSMASAQPSLPPPTDLPPPLPASISSIDALPAARGQGAMSSMAPSSMTPTSAPAPIPTPARPTDSMHSTGTAPNSSPPVREVVAPPLSPDSPQHQHWRARGGGSALPLNRLSMAPGQAPAATGGVGAGAGADGPPPSPTTAMAKGKPPAAGDAMMASTSPPKTSPTLSAPPAGKMASTLGVPAEHTWGGAATSSFVKPLGGDYQYGPGPGSGAGPGHAGGPGGMMQGAPVAAAGTSGSGSGSTGMMSAIPNAGGPRTASRNPPAPRPSAGPTTTAPSPATTMAMAATSGPSTAQTMAPAGMMAAAGKQPSGSGAPAMAMADAGMMAAADGRGAMMADARGGMMASTAPGDDKIMAGAGAPGGGGDKMMSGGPGSAPSAATATTGNTTTSSQFDPRAKQQELAMRLKQQEFNMRLSQQARAVGVGDRMSMGAAGGGSMGSSTAGSGASTPASIAKTPDAVRGAPPGMSKAAGGGAQPGWGAPPQQTAQVQAALQTPQQGMSAQVMRMPTKPRMDSKALGPAGGPPAPPKPSPLGQQSQTILFVITPYQPEPGSDELELVVGDRIIEEKAYDDGWSIGTSATTKKRGFFPQEFVSPRPASVTGPPPATTAPGPAVPAKTPTPGPAPGPGGFGGYPPQGGQPWQQQANQGYSKTMSSNSMNSTASVAPKSIRMSSSKMPMPAPGAQPAPVAQNQRLKILKVITPYNGGNPDELVLRLGDTIREDQWFDDGWSLGTNLMTQQKGFFPQEFTQDAVQSTPSGQPQMQAAPQPQSQGAPPMKAPQQPTPQAGSGPYYPPATTGAGYTPSTSAGFPPQGAAGQARAFSPPPAANQYAGYPYQNQGQPGQAAAAGGAGPTYGQQAGGGGGGGPTYGPQTGGGGAQGPTYGQQAGGGGAQGPTYGLHPGGRPTPQAGDPNRPISEAWDGQGVEPPFSFQRSVSLDEQRNQAANAFGARGAAAPQPGQHAKQPSAGGLFGFFKGR